MADWKRIFDDAVTHIGEGAKVAGEGLGKAAEHARKVAGIGIGTIEIDCPKTAYRGENHRGAVKLALTEPIDADRLEVSIVARRSRIALENLATKNAKKVTREVAFEHTVEVAGAQQFESGRYEFEFDLPEHAPEIDVDGVLGQAVRAAQAFKAMTESELRWELTARVCIPWRRNLEKTVAIVVKEPRAQASPPPFTPAASAGQAPRARPEAFRIPRGIPARGAVDAIEDCLRELVRRGEVIVHRNLRKPVAHTDVAHVLQRFPDVDAEVLEFYAAFDGLEIIIGQPAGGRGSAPESIEQAERAARERGGWLGVTHACWGGELGEALQREFAQPVRTLEIPRLIDLFDDESEHFAGRGGKVHVMGAICLRESDYFGITRADEIRSWRAPKGTEPGRDGYYDHVAETYQTALRDRERGCANRWWLVRGDDHGAALWEPAMLLRFGEMLAVCLDHLRDPDGR